MDSSGATSIEVTFLPSAVHLNSDPLGQTIAVGSSTGSLIRTAGGKLRASKT